MVGSRAYNLMIDGEATVAIVPFVDMMDPLGPK